MDRTETGMRRKVLATVAGWLAALVATGTFRVPEGDPEGGGRGPESPRGGPSGWTLRAGEGAVKRRG